MPSQVNIARLEAAAKALGHTRQSQIVAHTELSAPTISRIFSGTGEPKTSTLQVVARAYGIPLEELLLDETSEIRSAVA